MLSFQIPKKKTPNLNSRKHMEGIKAAVHVAKKIVSELELPIMRVHKVQK